MDNTLTLHFIDGSKLSFEFPEQAGNPPSRGKSTALPRHAIVGARVSS